MKTDVACKPNHGPAILRLTPSREHLQIVPVMALSLTKLPARLMRSWPRLSAVTLLLSLPAWSGCLSPESATITDDTISNTTGSGAYTVNLPPGYTAVRMPEYLPHVPFTQGWLQTEEAAPFAGFVQTQALEQKLHADLLLYRRPNYRAYFSISGEDTLLVPLAQADKPDPTTFLVFTVDNCRTANGQYAFPQLNTSSLRSFGNWLAGSLSQEASDVSDQTRTLFGRESLWLTARLPWPPKPANEDTDTAQTTSPADTKAGPVYGYFLYTATLGAHGNLYAVQGWATPENAARMVEAASELMGSLKFSAATH